MVKDINRIELNGSTALHVAAFRGHQKIVELLLSERTSKRFISEPIEWIISENDADYQAHKYIKILESYGNNSRRRIASTFYEQILDNDDQLSELCMYNIRNKRTALTVQHLSVYPHEEEVFILPYTVFKIIELKHTGNCVPQIEILLTEYEPWD
ncbi:hypothetical protein I4U23_004178 [Adineta vaga]|nr:hypothetical protein I4U23_004178 [Adineta vaga]